MKMKSMMLRGALALSLAAGLLLGAKTEAKATQFNTVQISLPEDHVDFGSDIAGMLPDIYSETSGVKIMLKDDQHTNYNLVSIGSHPLNSENGFTTDVYLSNSPKFQSGLFYNIIFYLQTENEGDTFSASTDVTNVLANGEPVSFLGSPAVKNNKGERMIGIILCPSDCGNATYDLSAANASYTFPSRELGLVLKRTIDQLAADHFIETAVNGNVTKVNVDCDAQGTYDFQLNIGNPGEYPLLKRLDTCSVQSGAFPFEISESEMANNGEGVCCAKGLFSEVTFNFGKQSIANATIAPIGAQDYTGQAITPAVTVTLNGKTLTAGTDYTVSYANNVKEGTATVTITGIGSYTGTLSTTFVIDNDDWDDDDDDDDDDDEDEVQPPAKVTISSGKNNAKKKITVKWKKVARAEGYEVAYTLDKKFKKNIKSKSTSKLNITIKNSKFKKKKTVYVKVRAYVLDDDDDRVYGPWSSVKKIKIKK